MNHIGQKSGEPFCGEKLGSGDKLVEPEDAECQVCAGNYWLTQVVTAHARHGLKIDPRRLSQTMDQMKRDQMKDRVHMLAFTRALIELLGVEKVDLDRLIAEVAQTTSEALDAEISRTKSRSSLLLPGQQNGGGA